MDGQNGKVKKTNFRIINSVERTWNQLDLFIRELKWVNFRYTLTFNNGGLLFQLKFFSTCGTKTEKIMIVTNDNIYKIKWKQQQNKLAQLVKHLILIRNVSILLYHNYSNKMINVQEIAIYFYSKTLFWKVKFYRIQRSEPKI